MMYGNETLWNLIALPLRRSGVKVHYEGSIAKIGDNSDWDWYMYEDPERNNEWVLFDVEGSGCIYNFVQHTILQVWNRPFASILMVKPSPVLPFGILNSGKNTLLLNR